MKRHWICETAPAADPDNMIQGVGYRITLLTSRLVRFEFQKNGEFIEEASQTVWYRNLGKVLYRIEKKKDCLEIETEHIRIRYDEKPYAESILSVRLLQPDKECDLEWYYGKNEKKNLWGTARTLDGID